MRDTPRAVARWVLPVPGPPTSTTRAARQQPGKPNQNAFVERFNRSFREEVLDAWLFNAVSEVQSAADDWLTDYNEFRPHESLGNVPPAVFKPRVFNAEVSTSGVHLTGELHQLLAHCVLPRRLRRQRHRQGRALRFCERCDRCFDRMGVVHDAVQPSPAGARTLARAISATKRLATDDR